MSKKLFSLALDEMSEAAISCIAEQYGLNKSAIVRRCVAYALSEAPAIQEMNDREAEARAIIGRLRVSDEPDENEINALRLGIDAMHRLAQA